MSDEVAHVLVWEGAAKNVKIKESIDDLVDEGDYLVIIQSIPESKQKHTHLPQIPAYV